MADSLVVLNNKKPIRIFFHTTIQTETQKKLDEKKFF